MGRKGALRSGVRVLVYAACFILFAFALRDLSFRDLGALLGGAPWLLPAMLGLSLSALALDACAVGAIARGVAPTIPPFFVRIRARLVGEAFALSLPAGAVVGETVAPVFLARRSRFSLGQSIATLVSRRFALVRAHGLYIVIGVGAGFSTLTVISESILATKALAWIVLASSIFPLAGSFAGTSLLTGGRLGARLIGFFSRSNVSSLRAWAEGQREVFGQIDRSFSSAVATLSTNPRVLFFLLLAWLTEALEAWLILRAIGVPVSLGGVIAVESGLSLVRSAAFFAPGGAGVWDLGYVRVFASLGVTDASRLAASFLLLRRSREITWMIAGYAVLWFGDSPTRPFRDAHRKKR